MTAATDETVSLYLNVSSFTIIDRCIPELIPYISNPTIDRRPLFLWNPVEEVSSYTIEVDSLSDFINPFIILSTNNTSFLPLSDLPEETLYWHVKSNTCESFSRFETIVIQPDSIPFLYRFNNEVIETLRPLFEWEPVIGATGYKIEIYKKDALNLQTVVTTTDVFFSPLADMEAGCTYYWRVSSSRNYDLFCRFDSLRIVIPEAAGSYVRNKKIRPIVSKREISFNGFIPQQAYMRIYNLTGACIFKTTFSGWATFPQLSSGHYIVLFSGKKMKFLYKLFVDGR